MVSLDQMHEVLFLFSACDIDEGPKSDMAEEDSYDAGDTVPHHRAFVGV